MYIFVHAHRIKIILNPLEHNCFLVGNFKSESYTKLAVATFMTRLMKKGWIDIYKLGRYSHYHPLITIEQYRKDKMMEFFDLYPHTEKDKLFQMITELMVSLAES